MATTTPAGTRADAVKNRAHILEIAASVISKEGVTGSMDTVMVSPFACVPGTADSWPTPRSVGIRS
ncbi:hypothetical protein O4328_21890 [Rhodococcus opacus]|uniref:Uncharacterized protein n=1 Tax=Rhodococcus opacus TaxID=37919 RepID=A0ABT4NFZ8_RHOOP|nr:hypothetical protein [Rhodococcus opacus]MCZ4586303.1 hypothetical protein [Rhodococcus opacus]